MELTVKDYMLMQPHFPKVTDADKYYLQLAQRVSDIVEVGAPLEADDDTRKQIALAVIGYFQDVVSDAGIWRSFITMCNHLYGSPLPFFMVSDDYVESELNREDLQFILWYVIDGNAHPKAFVSPLDSRLQALSQALFDVLDEEYLNAPEIKEYAFTIGVDTTDPDDANRIYELSSWLFWNCYFMKHATAFARAEAFFEAKKISDSTSKKEDIKPQLADLNDRTMFSNTAGPLALWIGEWIELMANDTLPVLDDDTASTPHIFYSQLLNATGGERLAFFKDYDSLEAFLCDDMGWGENPQGHLPQLRSHDNFVLFAHPKRGLLVAQNVAQFICHPANECYDSEQARAKAHMLVTEPGLCPTDLTKHLFAAGLLPDASLPGDDSHSLLQNNWDFLLRHYQQRFYRTPRDE